MPSFTVTQIVDGDTFAAAATTRLLTLILNKQVELGAAYRIDRGRIVCEVLVQGRNLKEYFPRYQLSFCKSAP